MTKIVIMGVAGIAALLGALYMPQYRDFLFGGAGGLLIGAAVSAVRLSDDKKSADR